MIAVDLTTTLKFASHIRRVSTFLHHFRKNTFKIIDQAKL